MNEVCIKAKLANEKVLIVEALRFSFAAIIALGHFLSTTKDQDYLGTDKQQIMLTSGYSAIVRTLMNGKATDDFYYDLNMQPVQCTGGYYGLHREYDEQGLNYRIYYLDNNRKPTINILGHAVIEYQHDFQNLVIGERYFDTEGNPARSLLGQYGELYQRDAQGYIGQITYLDADGNPAPTNAGYTNTDTWMYICPILSVILEN